MVLPLVLTTLSWQAHLHPAQSRHQQVRPRMMADDELDMSVLAARIQQVKESKDPSTVRLFVLDAMVPGQRLSFTAPAPFVETLQKHEDSLVMFGVDPSRRTVCSHGVGIDAESIVERPDGNSDVVLKAGKLCELSDLGADEGSRWAGREATVRWVDLDEPAPSEAVRAGRPTR